ncbi:MAG: putative YggU family [Candidatus Parcubacteria bacterium]
MRIEVVVKTNASQVTIEKIGEKKYQVAVREPARQHKANSAIIKVLAEYFKVTQAQIVLVRGKTNKIKIVDIRGL